MSDAPAIRLTDVQFAYGKGPRVLNIPTLEVVAKEKVFLFGPSGSGKTTLLSILGCVLRPTAGAVRVLDLDVTAAPERRLAAFRRQRLGFIFQGHNLIASQDATGNVRLPLMLAGVPAAEAARRAVAELDAVGLGDKVDRLPRDLSGGQRQRVAIARATAGRPPLILADEPTASLDATSGREVMELLTRLARERGTTVLVVTHDNRIFSYADRVIAIEDGRLVPEAA
jgi:putative ABC transport system ATP-binding protein